ncbi:MAG: family 78 glycoside hydrolase catalytic domain [Parabacteroides sp.]|nr:family 78 glycoside hydrolase catalytic domain [Parabacteroides sp.]
MFRYIILSFCLFSTVLNAASLRVVDLRCENMSTPLGIDGKNPMLSWKLESDKRGESQSAYEIVVGTDKESLLDKGRGLVWKSGKVKSSESLQIKYSGKKLLPFTRYYWSVRCYDSEGEVSDWSDVSYWETSMLSASDWKAQWITDGSVAPEKEEDFYKPDPSPLFRKDFRIDGRVKRARLYISGLGYYEASLNGEKIGDHCLDPGWTAYSKQVLYSTYDVTELVEAGDNSIGVMLGNGFFNPLPMRIFKPLREMLRIGRPCLKAQLMVEMENGRKITVTTDESWKTHPSPVMRNNVYLGEEYDAREYIKDWDSPRYNASSWKNAVLMQNPPEGELTSQIQPPIRVLEKISPKRMTETRPGEFVMDMGQNFAGVVGIKVKGPKGTKIRIRYGEDVYTDGSLNVMTSVAGQQKRVWNADYTAPGQPPVAWQEDVYVLNGDENGEEWRPRFTFHGFRYIEITGWPGRPSMDDVTGYRLGSDLERTGYFESSDEMLNKLFKVMDYTFRSNVFSVQSDCPAREKFGYGGDMVCVSPTFCWYYDMSNFYRKAIRDFANDQRPLGGMTETAPFNGIADSGLGDNSGPIGWQLAYGFLQQLVYRFYGDDNTLEKYYDSFKKQVDFISSNAEDYIIDRCINDHESLEERIPALFATAHYYHHVIILEEFSGLLGKKTEAEYYSRLSENIKSAFIKKFVNTGDGTVGNATQASQAIALLYCLVPENEKDKALDRLLQIIERDGYHVRSGIFGVNAVLNVLSSYGRNDVAYRMVTNPDFPGWMHMLKSGATTLWETWKYSDNVFSQNHPMFGSVGEWMFHSLGGIQMTSPGFRTFRIKPQPAEGLDWVKCSYDSSYGKIRSEWKKSEESFLMKIEIPVNTVADIYVPVKENNRISLNDEDVNSCKYVKNIAYMDGYAIIKVESGLYDIKVYK